MPAYRSPAEGEIRDAVVARIRAMRPGARIIHEINADGQTSNRIDLIAVDTAEILAFEIKSARDKLDRLPAQLAAMQGAAHCAIVVIHEKFLVERTTNQWAAHEQRDGLFYLRDRPAGCPHDAWVYPERRRAMEGARHDFLERWAFPAWRPHVPLPWNGLALLWRDELALLCDALRVSRGRRSTMPEMAAALRWHCTGRDLTLGICAALRRRECVEADPVCDGVAA